MLHVGVNLSHLGNLKSLKKSGSLYALGSILNASVSFILLPLFINELSVNEYGSYSLILLSNSIASAIFYFGITSALTRSYFDYDSMEGRANCFYTSLIILFFGAVCQITLGIIFGGALSKVLFGTDVYWKEIALMFSNGALSFINLSFLTLYRISNNPTKFFTCSVVTMLFNLILVYLMIIHYELGVMGVILGFLIPQFILLLFYIFDNVQLLKVAKIIKGEIKIQVKFGFQIVISSFLSLGILWSDQFFVNTYMSTYEVGVYALSVKLASAITVGFVNPFNQVFNPLALEQYRNNNAEKIIKSAYKLYLFFGFIFVLVFSMCLEELLYFFDKNGSYNESAKYLFVLMFSLYLFGLINVTALGFSFKRKMVEVSKVYLIAFIINLLLNYMLIPMYDIPGAVVSTFLSYLILMAMLKVRSNMIFEVNLPYGYIFTSCLLAAFYFIFLNFFGSDDFIVRLCFKLFVFMFVSLIAFSFYVFSKKNWSSE